MPSQTGRRRRGVISFQSSPLCLPTGNSDSLRSRRHANPRTPPLPPAAATLRLLNNQQIINAEGNPDHLYRTRQEVQTYKPPFIPCSSVPLQQAAQSSKRVRFHSETGEA